MIVIPSRPLKKQWWHWYRSKAVAIYKTKKYIQEQIIPYLRAHSRKQNGKYERPFKLLTEKNNFE